jgi:non-ribosomal peptide synthetase component F
VISFEDIVSECTIAWCLARDSWDEARGTPFLAYLRTGMRNHINRWVDKELKEHNGSHLEFDRSSGEDDDGSLHDVFADQSAELPDNVLELNERREKQLARLSPRARQFVELIDSPPKALVDILNGLRARQSYAVSRGLPALPVPKTIPAVLVFRFMGASRFEQATITEELETKFKLQDAYAKMDRIKR